MTNTLHRFGKPESLRDDFIVFIMAAKGINHIDVTEKIQAFLNTALKFNPVNIGNGQVGSMYRPEKDLNFLKLYFSGRREQIPATETVASFKGSTYAAVVFDNKKAMAGFLKAVKALDLGLSVNVSALVEDVKDACSESGITIHSIEYSLGFHGDLFRLPDRHVLALTTMCGHGMISANFARKLIDRVKEARITPEKAARYMAKFCVCGAFNTSRAARILNEIRTGDRVTAFESGI